MQPCTYTHLNCAYTVLQWEPGNNEASGPIIHLQSKFYRLGVTCTVRMLGLCVLSKLYIVMLFSSQHLHPQLGVESPPEMSSLAEQRGRQRQFLEQLLDTSKLENYAVPIPIKTDLWKYQQ